jgi:DNA helicase-2/ATP-dependent DNA helicase PcrA
MRWQLADSVVRRYGGELPVDIGALASVTQYVLGLADQLADHLVTPDDVADFASTALADWDGLPWGSARSATPKATAGYVKTQRDRLALVPLVRAFESAKRERGGVDYGDQMALAAALAELPDVAVAERSRYAAVLLDEYQDTGTLRSRCYPVCSAVGIRSRRSAIRTSRSTVGGAPPRGTWAGSRRRSPMRMGRRRSSFR